MSIFFGIFSLFSWWLLYLTMTRYRWDEQCLTRLTPLSETTLPWSAIERYEKRTEGAAYVYILHGPQKRKMSVDLGMYGFDSPLRFAIDRHADPMLESELQQITPDSTLSFPVLNNTGFQGVKFIFEPERITLRTRLRFRSLRYDEVRAVFMENKPVVRNLGHMCYYLSDGKRDRMRLTRNCRDFDKLIYCLRQRLPSAHWIDMASNTAPDNPSARDLYHRRRRAASRKKLLQSVTAAGVTFGWLGWLGVWFFSHRQNVDLRKLTGVITVLMLVFVYVLLRTGFEVRKQLGEQRRCLQALDDASINP